MVRSDISRSKPALAIVEFQSVKQYITNIGKQLYFTPSHS